MNTRILLAIGLTTLPLRSATAQWQPPPPQINVSGFAEVKIAPDEVDLSVSVETRHESLDEAKRQNDERISKALALLKHDGVEDKDIQTDYISIEPSFGRTIDPNTGLPLPVPILGYDRDDFTKPAYYLVRKGIGIKLTDVSSFDRVLTGLITNGVNQVQGIDFCTSELRKHKDKARAMAIRAAKEKAEAMAEELGVKVGKPYNITVNEWGDSISWSRVNKGFGGGGAGGGVQARILVVVQGKPVQLFLLGRLVSRLV